MKNKPTIILRVTFLNQLRALFPFLLVISFPIVGILYIIHKDGEYHFGPPSMSLVGILPLVFALACFACITLPALLFHIDYLLKNRNEEYEIGNGKLIRRKKEVEKEYSFEEIDDMFLYLTPPSFRNDPLPFIPYSGYHYAKVVMKSGEVLYLTCLLYQSGGIEKIFNRYMKEVSYWREKRCFPTTFCK